MYTSFVLAAIVAVSQAQHMFPQEVYRDYNTDVHFHDGAGLKTEIEATYDDLFHELDEHTRHGTEFEKVHYGTLAGQKVPYEVEHFQPNEAIEGEENYFSYQKHSHAYEHDSDYYGAAAIASAAEAMYDDLYHDIEHASGRPIEHYVHGYDTSRVRNPKKGSEHHYSNAESADNEFHYPDHLTGYEHGPFTIQG